MCISYDEALQAPLIEAGAERAALRRWQTCRDPHAIETLLRSHARMVHALARRWSRDAADRDDLVAAGMIGLLRAADQFDLARPVRFGTYARWWVQTLVAAEAAGQRSILSIPARNFHDLTGGRLDEAAAQALRAALAGAVSLETGGPETADDGRMGLTESLASETPSPEEQVLAADRQQSLRALIDGAVEALAEPARAVMRARTRAEPASHAEIASGLGLPVGRVRALEANAHARMRLSLLQNGFSPASLR